MNSPLTHLDNCYAGREDTPPWDQIEPFFAHSDQLVGELPLANGPANSGPGPVGGEFADVDPHLKSIVPIKKESQNELVLRGASLSPGNYVLRYRVLPHDRIPAPSIAISSLPISERIGIFGLMVLAVVTVVVLLVSLEEGFNDSVLPSSLLVAQPASPLLSVDDGTMGDPIRAASLGETPIVSQERQRRDNRPALIAETRLPSVAMPPRSERDTVPPPTGGPIAVSTRAALAPSELATGLADDEISTLMNRGQNLLKDGDFAAARLLFRRAADAGNAQAALALGSTYDPAVIKQLGAVAVRPDIGSALTWYATAADRGSADAAERYANLLRAH